MLRPLFDIRIETSEGVLVINRVNDIELVEDWREISNTGTIKIPRKTLVSGTKKSVVDLIKTGNPVVVKLGYMASNIPVSERWVTEFIGYVQQMPTPYAPVEIKIENEMFKLKRKPIKPKIFKGGKLADVVKYVAEGYDLDCVDMDLSSTFVVKQGSAALALRTIEEKFGIKSFFRLIPDKTKIEGARQVLVVGKPYSSKDLSLLTPSEDLVFKYGLNVVESSLKYLSANDARLRVKATNKLKKGKDYSIEVGDDDGTVINLTFNDLPNATLKKLAEDKLRQSKVDKFEGDLTGLGFPFVRVGRIVKYHDWRYQFSTDQLRFFVDKVVVRSGINGYRRVITLGWLASTQNQMRLTS